MTRRTVGVLLGQYLSLRGRGDERRAENLRDRLLVNYSPLVKYVVGKLSARATHPIRQEELMSSGIIGLLNAIETYDPGREAKFETYAISKIRWAILDDLRKEDRVPRRVRTRAKEAERAKTHLAQNLRRPPTEEEVSQELDLSLADYRAFLRQYYQSQVDSLDGPFGPEPDSPVVGRQVSSGEADPSELLERQEVYDQLVSAMEGLTDRERTVVTLYFYEGLTLREIGQALQLTEGRISQIMSRTLEKLRGFMPSEDFALNSL
ncbi:MAG: FliA/WhiG family RNA polymerase sigma factor [Rubrobacteraceae bacterium]